MASTHELTPTGHEGHDHHVLPMWLYYGVYGALLFLTVITVLVSFANLGPLALTVAMVIAVIKATFVIVFFMHLGFDSRFFSLILATSILFLLIFFSFTLFDLTARGEFVQSEKTFEAKKHGVTSYRVSPIALAAHHEKSSAMKVLTDLRNAEIAQRKKALAAAKASKAPKPRKPEFSYKAPSAAELAAGNKLFQANCKTCHGAKGDGDSAFAKSLPPSKRPRNYYTDKFKFGAELHQIFATITKGVPPLMAGFSGLSVKERMALAKWVRHIYVTNQVLKKQKK